MGLSIKTTTKPEDAAEFIVSKILNQLQSGKRVLFFVTGGSSIAVGTKVAQILEAKNEEKLMQNLSITLTDERYGILGHKDSNWHQLLQYDFSIKGAHFIPILTGDDSRTTVQKFIKNLEQELGIAEYKIGLFGVGKDGHTAGILPGSEAVNSKELACGYKTETFERITITPKVIEGLDEIVVWTQGEDKWPILENLRKNINIMKQPAQILKQVPLLTIFSDYKKI